MSDKVINVKHQQRHDTDANWTSKDPVLLDGEIGYVTGTQKYKIGDGTTVWSKLAYHNTLTDDQTTKLNGVASGANKTVVDSSLSSTSTNPVQNKVVNSALAGKSNTNHTHDLSTMINTLSTGTATPTDEDYYVSQYVGGGTTTVSYHRRPLKALFEYIKSKLATVAVSGSYNDLSNKPTIPTVGNGTVTIKQAGTSKGTFTMNQSGNTTIELTDNNTNTWRGIQDNLTSTSTTDSLSANQGKTLNENKLMHKTITTSKTDFDTLTETGVYHITITDAVNAPNSNHGTLYVDSNVGTKYQIFMSDNITSYVHKRYYDTTNSKWNSWVQQKLTDTVYTHPSYTAKNNGLYKVTVDATGHVSGTTAVSKSDITALGIPSTNTTYSTGTASTSGLTKLYTGTGTATDGTMTQAAIKSALDGKSAATHSHDDRYYTESEMNSKLDGKLNTSGGTLTGNVTRASGGATDVAYIATNSDTGKSVALMVGSGKNNRGVYDKTGNKWIAYADENNNIYLNGNASTATSATTATKLSSSAGSATRPVYFSDGKPVAGTYTLGNACSKTVRTLTSVGASGWKDASTDQGYVPDMSFIAYWNGAYSGTTSNLTYCNKGAFGTAVTKNTDYFATSGHTHTSVNDSNNATATSFAYSKDAVAYGNYTYLAAWNGYELRAVNKTQFATSGHNHDSTYLKLSGGTVTGVTSFTNTTASTSKTTGAIKVSGGLGVAGRMSSNEVMIGDGCTLQFDSTNKCLNFVFA